MIAATQSNHPLALVSGREATQASVEEANHRIRTAGMRVTKPRVSLIEALLRMQGPVSIEHIHREVGTRSCDLVTIYRSLAAFENLGLVRRSYLHNGTCLYEQTISAARRYHIICKDCGRSEPVEYSLDQDIEQKLHERGYARISHVVEFFGICPACQHKDGTAARASMSIAAPA